MELVGFFRISILKLTVKENPELPKHLYKQDGINCDVIKTLTYI